MSVMTPHHSYDPQVAIHDGQILKAVLAHDSQSLILRLIFAAVVDLFFHHTMDELCFAVNRVRRLKPFQAFSFPTDHCRVRRLQWCRLFAIDLSDELNVRIKVLVLNLVLRLPLIGPTSDTHGNTRPKGMAKIVDSKYQHARIDSRIDNTVSMGSNNLP